MTTLSATKIPISSTQAHLRIGEIRNDVVVMKDGGLRAVLHVSSLNFDLKSEREQNAILGSYQQFLNSLDFPLQIIVKSRQLELDGYLRDIEQTAERQTNELLKKQTYEYIEYVHRLIDVADIMRKEFYAVVPFDPTSVATAGVFAKFIASITPNDTVAKLKARTAAFEKNRTLLEERVRSVAGGLEGCGLHTRKLNTHELVELFYEGYNPATAETQKLDEVKNLDLEGADEAGK